MTKTDFELLEAQVVAAAAPVGVVSSDRPGIVVVGGGIAGWSVVEAIRSLDGETPITMVSACSANRYHKPELSVALSRGLKNRSADQGNRSGCCLSFGRALAQRDFCRWHQCDAAGSCVPHVAL